MTENFYVPFNKAFYSGNEAAYVASAIDGGHISGNGEFTKGCERLLEEKCEVQKALLAHSCTAALEMAAMLCKFNEGDEVIMPSYTFVSTANAFLLNGAKPVFVDIRADTLNIDEKKIEEAITAKTKAIVVVHYAGVSCEMDKIVATAEKHGIAVIEDAAQGIGSCYKGKPLGSFGQLSALSFHETKNISSGEGGALLINDSSYINRAEIIREKGTNRTQFINGLVDKYSWVDVGSSYLSSDMVAALLYAQLEEVDNINARRRQCWEYYFNEIGEFASAYNLRLPYIPANCKHNAHMFYLICGSSAHREELLNRLNEKGVNAAFHYVPLHCSEMGRKYTRSVGDMCNTSKLSGRLIRLPLWVGVEKYQQRIVEILQDVLRKI